MTQLMGPLCAALQVKLGIPGGEAMASAAAEMLIPLKRIGTPDEAAGAMLILASPYASFISGQVSTVDCTSKGRSTNYDAPCMPCPELAKF